MHATAMLSRTVIEANGFGIWCVRATPRCEPVRCEPVDAATVKPHFARGRRLGAAEDRDERRLAGAVRADQPDDLRARS